jgi:hypothetical protein
MARQGKRSRVHASQRTHYVCNGSIPTYEWETYYG